MISCFRSRRCVLTMPRRSHIWSRCLLRESANAGGGRQDAGQGAIRISRSCNDGHRLRGERRRDLRQHRTSGRLRPALAFVVGWPVAAVTGLVVLPFVRRITLRLIAWIEDDGA